jgi:hypothetical protein
MHRVLVQRSGPIVRFGGRVARAACGELRMSRLVRLLAAAALVLAPQWSNGQTAPPPPGADPTPQARGDEGQKAGPAGAEDVEKLRKQVEIQQKQIDVLEKMIRLLDERVKKGAPAAVEDLQTKTTLLESRSEQAALRDRELAHAADELREKNDAAQRAGPTLPATLRELFLPTRPNESPLAIYGTLAVQYEDFQDRPGKFPSPVFSPHLYLLLNEQFLFEVNPEFRADAVDLESAQVDWFLHDNLTLVFGRFYSPLGFFNERLHTSWVYKTPDRPLMFQQVLPAQLSLNGVMARGATYLFDWPVKLEYAGFVTNAFPWARAT